MLMLSHGSALLAAGSTTTGSGSTMLVVITLAAVLGWLVSLWLHPYRHCSRCNSVPRTYGKIFTGSFRICTQCGGNGRQKRFMANLWAKNRDLS